MYISLLDMSSLPSFFKVAIRALAFSKSDLVLAVALADGNLSLRFLRFA